MKREPGLSMEYAEAYLKRRGIKYSRRSRYHLKIAEINFYPHTGMIFVDREHCGRSDTGVHALNKILREHGHIREPDPPAPPECETESTPVTSANKIDVEELYGRRPARDT